VEIVRSEAGLADPEEQIAPHREGELERLAVSAPSAAALGVPVAENARGPADLAGRGAEIALEADSAAAGLRENFPGPPRVAQAASEVVRQNLNPA
jgi:hypothetical protein